MRRDSRIRVTIAANLGLKKTQTLTFKCDFNVLSTIFINSEAKQQSQIFGLSSVNSRDYLSEVFRFRGARKLNSGAKAELL